MAEQIEGKARLTSVETRDNSYLVKVKVEGKVPLRSGPSKEFTGTLELELPRGSLVDWSFEQVLVMVLKRTEL